MDEYRVIFVSPTRGANETRLSGYHAESLADQLFRDEIERARDGLLYAVILADGTIRQEWPKREAGRS